MYARVLYVLIGLIFAFLNTSAWACLWDSDTLLMERARFPQTLELITGKFVHHSQAYYQWRIQDRLKKLSRDPDNLNLQDDLAVAYDKTGNDGKAIELAARQLALHPKRYETLANLGTFYFHSGKLKEGLPFINKALQVNPNAHFGRERYQKYLVEYVLSDYKNRLLPNYLDSEESMAPDENSFADYLISHHLMSEDQKEVDKAIRGILGMMRFGNHRSPILLDALASLLLVNFEGDAKQLAARAYLRAADESRDPGQKRLYRALAKYTLMSQENKKLLTLETEYKLERQEADTWFNALTQDEEQWIAAGVDVDKAFNQKYYQEPSVTISLAGLWQTFWNRVLANLWVIVPVLLILFYIFQPKSNKVRRFDDELKDVIQGNVSLGKAVCNYFIAGMLIFSFLGIYVSYLIQTLPWLTRIIIYMLASVIPYCLVRCVWLAGKTSQPVWRWLSRAFALGLALYAVGGLILLANPS